MVDNPHFTNAINWAKEGLAEINKGLLQAQDEYERIEMIHREDDQFMTEYLKTIGKLERKIKAANEILDDVATIDISKFPEDARLLIGTFESKMREALNDPSVTSCRETGEECKGDK